VHYGNVVNISHACLSVRPSVRNLNQTKHLSWE